MSLLGQKMDTLTQLKVSTALGDGLVSDYNTVNSLYQRNSGGLQSLNPKNKDAIEYAIDLMTLLFGPDFLEKSVNKVMKKVFRRNSAGKMKLEEKAKNLLLDALCGNNGSLFLPADWYLSGYAVPVKTLDLFDLFKLNPGGAAESKLLGGATGFEKTFMTTTLQSTGASQPASFSSLPNIGFTFSFSNNAVTMTSISQDPSTTVEQFFRSILYAPGFKLYDPIAMGLEILDTVLGILSPSRSTRALANEECLKDLVGKIGNEEKAETVFTFNPKSLQELDERAKKRKLGGYNLDLGCETKNVLVAKEAILARIDTEPDFAGMFTSSLEAQLAADNTPLTGPIRQNFQRGLIKALVMVLVKHTLLNPRIWTLFVLSRIFQVGYPQSKYNEAIASGLNTVDINTILDNRQQLITELTGAIREMVMEYVTELLIQKITELVLPVVEEKAKESMASYSKIIASLTKVADQVTGGITDAASIAGIA